MDTGNQKHASAMYKACKLEFKLYDKKTGKAFNWFVNFDLDPNCIELQTEKKSYKFYEDNKGLLTRIIFDAAKDLGLCADSDPNTGGGGHISLDYATAFNSDPNILKKFIYVYQNIVSKPELVRERNLSDIILRLSACKDSVNAPLLSEIGDKGKELKFFNEVVYKKDYATTEEFVSDMTKFVYTECHYELEAIFKKMGQKITEQDRLHYQAINLESLQPGNDRQYQRVELRRFNAQSSIDELLSDLDAVYMVLCAAIQHK